MRNFVHTFALALALLLPLSAWSTDIKVTPLTSTEAAFYLEGLEVMWFQADSMFTMTTGTSSIASRSISAPVKITFESSTTTGLDDVQPNVSVISFYPNPARDILHITGVEKETLVRMFNISGHLMISELGINEINVQSLPLGTYILQVGNEAFKVVKE